MASRMDRYNNEASIRGRSDRNKSLYRQIEDLDSYTNIEGVATIEKTNEIDISKVKEMLKNRESYKKHKELRGIIKEEEKKEEPTVEKVEETRNYDINDILSKLKEETKEENKYRSLGEEQFKVLKSLNKKGKDYDIEKEEKELKELINTLTATKALTNNDDPNDVGLLDELKSDTMVGDVSSIKKIIEEEKQVSKPQEEEKEEIDKSFYTSSFGFTQKDFEELKSMNHNIKKSNKFIIILLVVLIVLVAAGALYFVLT